MTTTVAAMPGGSGGFLNRITMLEREVVFLKSKVEEDARWKGILEKWMLENFGKFLKSEINSKTQLLVHYPL
jgi:hypothetical protein